MAYFKPSDSTVCTDISKAADVLHPADKWAKNRACSCRMYRRKEEVCLFSVVFLEVISEHRALFPSCFLCSSYTIPHHTILLHLMVFVKSPVVVCFLP